MYNKCIESIRKGFDFDPATRGCPYPCLHARGDKRHNERDHFQADGRTRMHDPSFQHLSSQLPTWERVPGTSGRTPQVYELEKKYPH